LSVQLVWSRQEETSALLRAEADRSFLSVAALAVEALVYSLSA
jgi:hypothetical protein